MIDRKIRTFHINGQEARYHFLAKKLSHMSSTLCMSSEIFNFSVYNAENLLRLNGCLLPQLHDFTEAYFAKGSGAIMLQLHSRVTLNLCVLHDRRRCKVPFVTLRTHVPVSFCTQYKFRIERCRMGCQVRPINMCMTPRYLVSGHFKHTLPNVPTSSGGYRFFGCPTQLSAG